MYGRKGLAEEVGFEPTTRFSPSTEVLGCLICAQMCWVESMEITFFLMVSIVFAVSFAVKLERYNKRSLNF